MTADGFTECWLCNVDQENKDVIAISVSMPDEAMVCVDCIACVLKRCNIGELEIATLLTSVTGMEFTSQEPAWKHKPEQFADR